MAIKALIGVILLVAAIMSGGIWLRGERAKPNAPAALVGMEIPPKIVAAKLPKNEPPIAPPPPPAPTVVQPAPEPPEPAPVAAKPAAEPKPSAPKKPVRIAIVIDDAGIDAKRTRRAIALPGPLTIAFLVYGNDIIGQTKAAKAAGHELLVHVNMEAESRNVDPGPKVLLRNVEPDTNLKRLDWMLGRFQGYVGVNNHMGSKFTSDAESMTLILTEIKRRNLLFLDSRTSPKTVAGKIARSLGIRTAARDIFLDNEPELEAVQRNLARTEAIARRTGAAIAIGHPKDATLDALSAWLPAAVARGVQLVPISALVSGKTSE
ncbi:MAG: divergent polysaccharide deacetylase family protein [Rhodospirillaceae bacterium]|nr:divergent polysaccharide deacetylase family protein [Rhodospirillaceae bacterium]MBT4671514.1 divergent polysaccharide deacetylase family protein [Rhodospirillaceae bacterium]